jgi:hypothetical protein
MLTPHIVARRSSTAIYATPWLAPKPSRAEIALGCPGAT